MQQTYFLLIIVVVLVMAMMWNWNMFTEYIPSADSTNTDLTTYFAVIMLFFVVVVMVISMGRMKKVH